ncbi:MAG: zinc ribbon domain-containing protein, partial [Chloroflexi bacterium]|nr:zinc ribbon domain-containing protein [Chloroflexota bacterium]
EAFIEQELWDQVQVASSRNRTTTRASCPPGSHVNSFTGLPRCFYCGERIHTQSVYQGKPRLGCSTRIKGWECQQASAYLSVYEPQTLEYLKEFHIPEDYQKKIMEYYRRSDSTQGDLEAARKRLERQLERERDLYRLGDLTEGEYKRRRDDIRRQLDALNPVPSGSDKLPRLAQFLSDVSSAWESATAEQQNKLARALFEEIWIKDKKVVFVKPRPELDPFFRLNYEESTKKAFEGVTSTRVELYRTPYLRNSALATGMVGVELLAA